MASFLSPIDLAKLPQELLVAVVHEGWRDADMVGHFLDAVSQSPPWQWLARKPVYLPAEFLLGLGAALHLHVWEWNGILVHREAGLPSAHEALLDVFQLLTDPESAAKTAQLPARVIALFMAKFAWTARVELNADVTLGEAEESAAGGAGRFPLGPPPALTHLGVTATMERANNQGLVYCRRSTDKQEISLPSQVEWAIQAAGRQGVTLDATIADLEHMQALRLHRYKAIYLDDGITGSDLTRPGFVGINRDALADRRFSHIFIYKRDRFARPTDALQAVQIEKKLLQAGITLVFSDARVPADPVRGPEHHARPGNDAGLLSGRRGAAQARRAGAGLPKEAGRRRLPRRRQSPVWLRARPGGQRGQHPGGIAAGQDREAARLPRPRGAERPGQDCRLASDAGMEGPGLGHQADCPAAKRPGRAQPGRRPHPHRPWRQAPGHAASGAPTRSPNCAATRSFSACRSTASGRRARFAAWARTGPRLLQEDKDLLVPGQRACHQQRPVATDHQADRSGGNSSRRSGRRSSGRWNERGQNQRGMPAPRTRPATRWPAAWWT